VIVEMNITSQSLFKSVFNVLIEVAEERVIRRTLKPLTDNMQHSQEKNVRARVGFELTIPPS